MKYHTAFSRDGKFMISRNSLEDNPLIAFELGIVEANNEEEAEQKAVEIFKKRIRKINTMLGGGLSQWEDK